MWGAVRHGDLQRFRCISLDGTVWHGDLQWFRSISLCELYGMGTCKGSGVLVCVGCRSW